MMSFILTSIEAELLIQFEQNPSLEMLANALSRDQTAISRQLKRVSEKGDFLTKVSGRWKITENGKRMNLASKDYLFAQKKIITQEVHLKIGSTREFCSRVLALNVKKLKEALNVQSLSIISLENSVENALLSGQIDLAFDCGRPYSPDIRYKKVIEEPISPVVSSKLLKKMNGINSFKDLENYPHILCSRLFPEKVARKPFYIKDIAYFCNDISTARNLCLASHGWALLPIYTIKDELKTNKLKIVNGLSFSHEKFGVWSLRERKSISPIFDKAVEWLVEVEDLMRADKI